MPVMGEAESDMHWQYYHAKKSSKVEERPIRPSPTARVFGDPRLQHSGAARTSTAAMMTGSKKVFLVKKTIDLDLSPGRRDVASSESRQSIKPVKQSSTLYETLLASHGLTSKSRKTAIKLQEVKANVE